MWVRLSAITGIALNYANLREKNKREKQARETKQASERANVVKLELLINLWIGPVPLAGA